jgi:hypothetical protein
MKPDAPRDRLLADLLAAAPDADPGAAFARRIAARVRRRRIARRATLAASLTIAAAFAIFTVAPRFSPNPATAPATTPLAAAEHPAPSPNLGYTLITDEELFALLPDEPLLITTQPDGTRSITLLATLSSP